MKPGFADLVRAEFYAYTRFYKNNRVFLFMAFVWPYLLVLVLLGLGYLFGSPEIYARRMGVRNPVFFIASASSVAMSSLIIVEDVAGYTIYNRWNGTLPYILLTPTTMAKQLLAASLPSTLLSPAVTLTAILPVAVYYEGLRGAAIVASLYGVIVLGMLPLAGLAVLIAGLVLIVREESNIASSLSPFLLLVSGIFYPVTVLPEILQVVSEAVPLRYVVEFARALASHGAASSLFYAVYVLTLMAFAYNIVAAPMLSRIEEKVKQRGID
ncbi:ABC transporter permease [Pyrofollis japonicus]|uniref:ABC transporter permease n=1 Tax=Pyrofollis japonicus TaxID=3060460 RepID=UPI00295BC13E|nr:ABC transporter permease [Pyrofollis japonicus]BEP17231.1 ABC transporter permease [Pyrofollis japonicus]